MPRHLAQADVLCREIILGMVNHASIDTLVAPADDILSNDVHFVLTNIGIHWERSCLTKCSQHLPNRHTGLANQE